MKYLCTTCEDSGILPEFVGLCSCAAGRDAERRRVRQPFVNLDQLKRDLEAIGYKPKLYKAKYVPTHMFPMCGYAELDVVGDSSQRNVVYTDGRWRLSDVNPTALLVIGRRLTEHARGTRRYAATERNDVDTMSQQE